MSVGCWVYQTDRQQGLNLLFQLLSAYLTTKKEFVLRVRNMLWNGHFAEVGNFRALKFKHLTWQNCLHVHKAIKIHHLFICSFIRTLRCLKLHFFLFIKANSSTKHLMLYIQ